MSQYVLAILEKYDPARIWSIFDSFVAIFSSRFEMNQPEFGDFFFKLSRHLVGISRLNHFENFSHFMVQALSEKLESAILVNVKFQF